MNAPAIRRRIALVLLLAALPWATPLAAVAQAPAPTAGPDVATGVWPRQLDVNGNTVLVYQPQVDRWDGNRLDARAAVAVRAPGAAQPSFGVIWISARTDVDKASGVVTLEDVQIPKVNFPASPQKNPEYLRAAR